VLRGIALLLCASTSACFFVVPKTKTRTSRTWEERDNQAWAQPAQLTAEIESVAGATVSVHAHYTGNCVYDRVVHTEKRRWRGASFKVIDCGGSDCGYAYAFGLLAAPITIPVSALITWGAIAGDETTTIVETERKPMIQQGCTADAAGVAVTVVGAGQEVPATTDAQGRARVQLRDEATARSVTVHVHAPPSR
jgi:hypothetical protein